MVRISYQMYGSSGLHLRLRLYQNGDVRYVYVNHLLRGDLQKNHWNQKRQRLIPSAPCSAENNETLRKFREPFDRFALEWDGSLDGLMAAMQAEGRTGRKRVTVTSFINRIADQMESDCHEDGSRKGSFENYLKLDKRLEEYFASRNARYPEYLLSELTPAMVDDILEWVRTERNGKGLVYISKNLHAVLMKADREGLVDFSHFKRCRWCKVGRSSKTKTYSLTDDQVARLVNMKLEEFPECPNVQLYRDFAVFILHTGQSPCDALSMKASNIITIGGVAHFVFKRRKLAHKQVTDCNVPIGKEMMDIIERWQYKSPEGYIFPVRSSETAKRYRISNGDIKTFVLRFNVWLKALGEKLGCTFPLHAYTFRHTAITRYISKGVPAIYVANMMGTSVELCESVYYNNQADTLSRNKTLAAMVL